jgi:tetratricopeptide (TPR) repeat protein
MAPADGKTGRQNFQAYDYFQRGLEFLNHFTQEDTARASECFHKAVDLDPTYGKPYAKIAWAHMTEVLSGWSSDPTDSMAKALDFATLAIARDDDEPWGHWALAGYHMIRGQHDRAIAAYLAAGHAALGHVDQARKAVARVTEFDPQATLQWCTTTDMAPYKDPKDLEHFRENLRKAGLPE